MAKVRGRLAMKYQWNITDCEIHCVKDNNEVGYRLRTIALFIKRWKKACCEARVACECH